MCNLVTLRKVKGNSVRTAFWRPPVQVCHPCIADKDDGLKAKPPAVNQRLRSGAASCWCKRWALTCLTSCCFEAAVPLLYVRGSNRTTFSLENASDPTATVMKGVQRSVHEIHRCKSHVFPYWNNIKFPFLWNMVLNLQLTEKIYFIHYSFSTLTLLIDLCWRMAPMPNWDTAPGRPGRALTNSGCHHNHHHKPMKYTTATPLALGLPLTIFMT